MAKATVETANFVATKLDEATALVHEARIALAAAISAINETETEPELKNAQLEALRGALTVAAGPMGSSALDWKGYAQARASH